MESNPAARHCADARPAPMGWPRQSEFLWLAAPFVYKQFQFIATAKFGPTTGYALGTLGAACLLAAAVGLAPLRRRAWAFAVTYTLFTLLLYGDLAYLGFYGSLPSLAVAAVASQLGDVSSGFAEVLRRAGWRFWMDVPLVVLLYLSLYRSPRTRTWSRPNWTRPAAWALMGATVLALAAMRDPSALTRPYGRNFVAGRFGIASYHLYDVVTVVQRNWEASRTLTPDRRTELLSWLDRQREQQQAQGELFGIATGKSVIMLQLESFQGFLVGKTVGGIEVTPNLNRLLRESLWFPHFYTQIGDGTTADADFAVNCSLNPLAQGVVYVHYQSNDFRCLPQLLQENGYATLAGNGANGDFWNVGTMYPRLGFDRFYNLNNLVNDEFIGLGLSDATFFQQMAAVLKTVPRPFHAFLMTLTNHFPFSEPKLPKDGLDFGEFEGHITGNYLHTARYTDTVLGRFVDEMRTAGILDDAVLLMYGDHGTVLDPGDPLWSRLVGLPPDAFAAWNHERRRTPLIMRLPGGARTGIFEQPIAQVDVAPTLAHLLGISTQDRFFMGRDIFSSSVPLAAFRAGAATDGRFYFVAPEGDRAAASCFQFPSFAPTSLDNCNEVEQRGQEQQKTANALIQGDLLRRLAPPAGRVTAVERER